ncbi:MAG TPA: hypothetical protein VK797_17495 [Tepidisphaeraceae bacterium]|jgi:hypothetical protein|nr:hypothetical protein [Tepidisphaeraceae bacterium]
MNIAMHGLVRIVRPENFAATLGSMFKGTPLPPKDAPSSVVLRAHRQHGF